MLLYFYDQVTAEGDVLAYLEANFSRIAQGTVLCKLDEGLEPLPHGVFQIQISLNGQQVRSEMCSQQQHLS